MKGHSLSLLAGALVLFAALPQATQAQAVCMVDGFGYAWDLTLNNNFLTGTMESAAPFTWGATAARGTTGPTRRHHAFTAVNPNTGGDPGCGDGIGWVDWLTYNGNVGSPSGGVYPFNGRWLNSCGTTGNVTGTITFGACPAPRVTDPAPNGPAAVPPQVGASARTTPEGYALAASPNPFEAGAVISYTIPERSDVRITVYDALGREVAVLVDEAREAGTHTVTLDGASLAAGTYLAHIVAGTYTEARQMTLTR